MAEALLVGRDEDTSEWMVYIDNPTECVCEKKWFNHNHECIRYFGNVQSAIAYIIGFERNEREICGHKQWMKNKKKTN
mgnify:CR=1 FL=1|jgi:hypothetical protein